MVVNTCLNSLHFNYDEYLARWQSYHISIFSYKSTRLMESTKVSSEILSNNLGTVLKKSLYEYKVHEEILVQLFYKNTKCLFPLNFIQNMDTMS